MENNWAAQFQARVQKSIAKERNASLATLANLECAGKLDWAIKLNVWFAVSN